MDPKTHIPEGLPGGNMEAAGDTGAARETTRALEGLQHFVRSNVQGLELKELNEVPGYADAQHHVARTLALGTPQPENPQE